MTVYNSQRFKTWYKNNRERIRDKKKTSKKKYRLTPLGRAANRKYQQKPSRKRYIKDRNFKLRYGITLVQYEELVEKCKGLCAICNKYNKILHVDHDHATLKFRGLLCGNCNRALGLLKDNPIFLAKAIEYLKNVY